MLAPDGKPFNFITLSNRQKMQITLMDWGATWLSCLVPIGEKQREVLLGCPAHLYPKQTAYLGATVGRYANRIANSCFELNGEQVELEANQGKHQLHGGKIGFDQRRWQIVAQSENTARLALFSADGEQGFKGNVKVEVCYHLSEQNTVEISFSAESDQDTPLNLTNHAYFNLGNAEFGSDIRTHFLQIKADYFLPVDAEGIPNAPLTKVDGTSFDFRTEKRIERDFLQGQQLLTKGYDHSFLLNCSDEPCIILTAPDRSLRLAISTSQPAIQIYTGNYLNGTPNRHHGYYSDYTGIALETQALPDTPNHPEWHKLGGIYKAGEKYQHWTRFQFQ